MTYLPQFDRQADRFDRLPRVCMAREPSTEKPILIHRGMPGYTSVHPDTDVERFNEVRGISESQKEAMLAGSMFGWNVPAADPLQYQTEPMRGSSVDDCTVQSSDEEQAMLLALECLLMRADQWRELADVNFVDHQDMFETTEKERRDRAAIYQSAYITLTTQREKECLSTQDTGT